jgi:hypothetical protein
MDDYDVIRFTEDDPRVTSRGLRDAWRLQAGEPVDEARLAWLQGPPGWALRTRPERRRSAGDLPLAAPGSERKPCSDGKCGREDSNLQGLSPNGS